MFYTQFKRGEYFPENVKKLDGKSVYYPMRNRYSSEHGLKVGQGLVDAHIAVSSKN